MRKIFYRLAPDLGIRSALLPRVPVGRRPRGGCRKVCSSKFACALLGGGWRAGDGRMWASAPTGVMGTWRPCKHTGRHLYRPVGADALVGPRLPPGQRQRKEKIGVSGTSPGTQYPQGERVSVPDCRKGAPTFPRRRPEVRTLRGPTLRSDFFFWTVHCAAVGGFAAYGCGVPLAGTARLSPA